MLSCVFSPGPCISGALSGFADAFLSLFPFGFTGLVFFAGLIVGERLGKWGVMAVILGWIAYRFGKTAVPDFDGGNVSGSDAARSPRRPKVLVGRTAKRSGKRKYNPDTNEWE
jgi:hypothetical protein